MLNDQQGYLSRSSSILSGFGTENCPWYLETKTTQKLKITLIDFASTNSVRRLIQTGSEGVEAFSSESGGVDGGSYAGDSNSGNRQDNKVIFM